MILEKEIYFPVKKLFFKNVNLDCLKRENVVSLLKIVMEVVQVITPS